MRLRLRGPILDLVGNKMGEFKYHSVLARFILSKENETWDVVACRFIFKPEYPEPPFEIHHVNEENFTIVDFSLQIFEFNMFLDFLKKSNTEENLKIASQETRSGLTYKFGDFELCFVGLCPISELQFNGRIDNMRIHGIPQPGFHTEYYIDNSIAGNIPREVNLSFREKPFTDAIDAINFYWNTDSQHHEFSSKRCHFFLPVYDASMSKISVKDTIITVHFEISPETKKEELSISVIAKAESHSYNKLHELESTRQKIDIKFTPEQEMYFYIKMEKKSMSFITMQAEGVMIFKLIENTFRKK